MAVNRYNEHLVVLVEDKPYRSIMNGIKNLLFDVKDPCGGWLKVFETFEKNVFLLDRYSKCHILLLMDFDDTIEGIVENGYFQSRMNILNQKVPKKYKERVFLLGINYEASEDLKRKFDMPFEGIGKLLVEDCPNSNLSHWKNIHLECNLPEIERMRRNGIFDWLFI